MGHRVLAAEGLPEEAVKKLAVKLGWAVEVGGEDYLFTYLAAEAFLDALPPEWLLAKALDHAEAVHLNGVIGECDELHVNCPGDCPHHTLRAKLRSSLALLEGERDG